MPITELTDKETAIREKLIKAASERKTVYYSELTDVTIASERAELGRILGKIIQYDIENKQPILASIVVLKETGLPSEGFFELCDTLDIDAYLSDLQRKCFELWSK